MRRPFVASRVLTVAGRTGHAASNSVDSYDVASGNWDFGSIGMASVLGRVGDTRNPLSLDLRGPPPAIPWQSAPRGPLVLGLFRQRARRRRPLPRVAVDGA